MRRFLASSKETLAAQYGANLALSGGTLAGQWLCFVLLCLSAFAGVVLISVAARPTERRQSFG